MAWKVRVDTGEDRDEVGLEVLYLYLGDVAVVAVRGDELKFASFADEGLHMAAEHSLSRTCFLGATPASLTRASRGGQGSMVGRRCCRFQP
ncbi:hypothetical protein THAOC_00324 [Thalassiosira oceanica]|uniref:Uncharacterized protein n=1 Tax=Thalassiosira oceanica TaxID=159749 RepID=K0TPC6_THAOC|nr:hypothetical protein THAOC_00324 [Thalassiosira oceanica]|eukprot:EJK77816.1 hypothetical protein THAOC_00324 [Thalassiosira oceanica]